MPPKKATPLVNDLPASVHKKQARETLRNFRIIFSSVRRHFHWVETQCGVSGSQLWAIGKLHETPGCKVSDLARAMSIHQSTASNLLDKLESKGLIEKRRDGPDQRVVRLHLTPLGTEIVERAPQPFEGVLPNALDELPYETLLDLNKSLILLIENMKIKDEKAASTPLADLG